MKQAFAIFTILWSSATLSGQAMNTLSAQDRGQGWQLLLDGKTLAGWHVSTLPGAPEPVRLSRRNPVRSGRRSPVSRREQNPRRRARLTGKSSMICILEAKADPNGQPDERRRSVFVRRPVSTSFVNSFVPR
ncbi:MAG: hypothetical protein ACRD2N_20190 [Vicinamibacterales bacterium]